MPRYVIERQFLVPMYEHIFVEAPDVETACREALDDYAQPWGDDAKLDWDSAGSTAIARAVEIPDGILPKLKSAKDADQRDLSLVLYDSGLDLLPTPEGFAEPGQEPRGDIGFS